MSVSCTHDEIVSSSDFQEALSDTDKAFLRVRNNFGKVYEADIADIMCYVYVNQYILFSLVTETESSELLI